MVCAPCTDAPQQPRLDSFAHWRLPCGVQGCLTQGEPFFRQLRPPAPTHSDLPPCHSWLIVRAQCVVRRRSACEQAMRRLDEARVPTRPVLVATLAYMHAAEGDSKGVDALLRRHAVPSCVQADGEAPYIAALRAGELEGGSWRVGALLKVATFV